MRRLTIADVKSASAAGSALVDIRKSTSFGAAFIPGSINIGLTPSSADWLKMVVATDRKLILISDYDAEFTAAAERFEPAGYQIEGFLDGGVYAWAEVGEHLDHLPQLTVHSLREVLDKYPDHILLDVRTDEEWAEEHLQQARHKPVAAILADGFDEVQPHRHITALCGSGHRSNIAGSYLKSQGFRHVYSVLGGTTAWYSAFEE